jgi:hypothetical protein
MIQPDEFVIAAKKKRQYLTKRLKEVRETDIKLGETLTRKIELLNIMIAEFGRKPHRNSIKNLNLRAKF